MGIEAGEYINDLVPTNPDVSGEDDSSQGDDHLRLLKKVLIQSFPNISGEVSWTQDEINSFEQWADEYARLRTQQLIYGNNEETTYDPISADSVGSDNTTNLLANGGTVPAGGLNELWGDNIKSIQDQISGTDNGHPVDPANPIGERLTDLEAQAGNVSPGSELDLKDKLYPIGSIYQNGSNNNNPSVLMDWPESTWVQIAQGRVLIGAGQSSPDTNGIRRTFSRGAAGGEYEHTQTISEMPKHSHGIPYNTNDVDGGGSQYPSWLDRTGKTDTSNSAGGGNPFNIVQPYHVVNIWMRTA